MPAKPRGRAGSAAIVGGIGFGATRGDPGLTLAEAKELRDRLFELMERGDEEPQTQPGERANSQGFVSRNSRLCKAL